MEHYTEQDVAYEKAYTERLEMLREMELKEKELKHSTGTVGSWLGTGEGAKINAAFVLIVIAVFFLVATYFMGGAELSDGQLRLVEKSWDIFPAFITLALGYIFGQKDRTK